MAYSNSPLVQYTKISPNKTTSNRKPIDRVTIHHAAGNILVESMGEMFARAAQRSSSNYGIGTNGKIGMYVEEKHSSWCSSSTANDSRAVTIEVANSSNTNSNWPVSDAALDSTIKLVADICKRNGKNKLVYLGTKAATEAYNPKSNEMVLTRHDFYKQKTCLPMDTELFTPYGWKKLSDIQIGDKVLVADFKDGESHAFVLFNDVDDIVEPREEDVYTNGLLTATKDHAVAVQMPNYESTSGLYMKTLETLKDAADKAVNVAATLKTDGGDLVMKQLVVPLDTIKDLDYGRVRQIKSYVHEFRANDIKKVDTCLVSCVTVKTGKIVVRQDVKVPINGNNSPVAFVVSNCPGPYLGGKFPYIVDEVNKLLGSNNSIPVVTTPSEDKVYDINQDQGIDAQVWRFFAEKGLNDYAVAGIEGNLYAESGLAPNNLQYTFEQKLGMTDNEYTAAVDSGSYKNFGDDGAGYGIAQWTYPSRKKGLKTYAVLKQKSISDLQTQLEYLWSELNQSFPKVLEGLKNATSVQQASDLVLMEFEKPANAETHKAKRLNYAEGYYNKFKGAVKSASDYPYLVRVTANTLNIRKNPGTNYEKIGSITDHGVYTIVAEADGPGATKWGQLKPIMDGGWISLDYTTRI